MKALLLRQHGGLENLDVVTDKPIPQVVEGHVVIRVRASSFNYHDVFTMRGMPGIKVPLPVIIGLDMAGEISEVGPGVTGWKAGDRVLVNPVNKTKGLMGECSTAAWRNTASSPLISSSPCPRASPSKKQRRCQSPTAPRIV